MGRERELEEKIAKLERENDILKRENKYLKNLTSSKRFVFAERIATGYNGVFPKNTKRRNIMEKIGSIGKRVLNEKKERKEQRIGQK